MPKNTKKVIKKDTEKIIKSLRQNSKENLDRLAARIGCSRQKIWRIIKKLEEKTIWGYTIVFSREFLDMKRFIITIKLNAMPLDEPSRLENIQKAISEDLEKQIKNVLLDCFFFVHGPYDIFMVISAKDIKDALRVRNFLYQKIGENIKDTRISEVLFNFVDGGIKNPQIKAFRDFYKK